MRRQGIALSKTVQKAFEAGKQPQCSQGFKREGICKDGAADFADLALRCPDLHGFVAGARVLERELVLCILHQPDF